MMIGLSEKGRSLIKTLIHLAVYIIPQIIAQVNTCRIQFSSQYYYNASLILISVPEMRYFVLDRFRG